jgi:hypothetical protein
MQRAGPTLTPPEAIIRDARRGSSILVFPARAFIASPHRGDQVPRRASWPSGDRFADEAWEADGEAWGADDGSTGWQAAGFVAMWLIGIVGGLLWLVQR